MTVLVRWLCACVAADVLAACAAFVGMLAIPTTVDPLLVFGAVITALLFTVLAVVHGLLAGLIHINNTWSNT